jgi:hypothetical protein
MGKEGKFRMRWQKLTAVALMDVRRAIPNRQKYLALRVFAFVICISFLILIFFFQFSFLDSFLIILHQ